MFGEARMGRTVDAERCLPLVEEIASSVLPQPGALISLARLKTKDDYTYMHSVAVCALMVALDASWAWTKRPAARSAGRPAARHRQDGMMPLDVLNKPGKLTEAGVRHASSRTRARAKLLQEGRGVGETTLDVVLHHHERSMAPAIRTAWPATAISMVAAWARCATSTTRSPPTDPYKAGWDPADSIARMASWKGHFDGLLLSGLRAQPGHLPDRLAGAPGVGPPGGGDRAEPRTAWWHRW
jgi:HD-GYP domain-containing protein (c-di-GMP phosphodiesterase class II)